jgi:hypothetical protein
MIFQLIRCNGGGVRRSPALTRHGEFRAAFSASES